MNVCSALKTIVPDQVCAFVGTGDYVEIPPDCTFLEGEPVTYANLLSVLNQSGAEFGGSIPPGYTRLEYLEASGMQFIDTGIATDGTYTISARMQLFSSSKDVWGRRSNNGGEAGSALPYGNSVLNTYDATKVVINYVWRGYNRNSPFDLKQTHDYVVTEGQQAFIVDGVSQTVSSMNPWSVKAANLDNLSHFLFWTNVSNGVARLGKAIASIYSFSMADGEGNVVLDLVPILDADGTPCMYDKVSRKCFYNKGTGSFIAGMTLRQLPALLHLPRVTSGELTLSLPWEAQLIASGAPAILEEVKNRGWTLIVQYAEPDTESAVYNKYVACTNRSDVEAVNPNYRNDLTSDGKWFYPLPNMVSVTQKPEPWFFQGSPVTELDIELPKLTEAYYMFRNASKLKKARVSMPLLTDKQRSFFEDCPLEELYVYAPNLTNLEAFIIYAKLAEITEDMIVHGELTNLAFFGNRMPNLRRVALSLPKVTYMAHSFKDCGLLTSFECDLPSLSNAESSFRGSILNKESALRILNTIPSYSSGTHKLGLGVHIDHKTDEEVLTAIDNAEAKGWTLTVQWNGTATAAAASTYGLRKPPIYAKAATIERPDGITEQTLDWGHYVTNWEENGYTEFASLEEAYAHFNLTMPE